MHDAHHVLEPGVLGGGKDPPGGLELVDLAEALDPGMVDDLAFGRLASGTTAGKGDVAVNGVVTEVLGKEVAHGWQSGVWVAETRTRKRRSIWLAV